MKSTANNHMVYAGTVKLSQRIGKQTFEVAKLDNAGGAALFDFLSDCLAGNFDSALVKRPVKIKLLLENASDPGTFAEDEGSGFIYLSTLPEKSIATREKGVVVRYSFLVTREQSKVTFNHIGLYAAGATDINDYAAVVSVPEDVLNVFNTSTDAIVSAMVIDWELNISNKENA